MTIQPPAITSNLTPTFGIPRGRAGRNGHTVLGIVLHCLDMDFSQRSAETARLYRDLKAKPPHASLHYVVGANGEIQKQVEDGNIAWGHAWYISNFALRYPMNIVWELANQDPPVTPDYYVINIGLIRGKDHQQCTGDEVLASGPARASLVHLMAWLCQEHDIAIDTNHIALHRDIDAFAADECGECASIDDILSDVSNYCQPCAAPFSGQATDGKIARLLGLSEYLCDNQCFVTEDVVDALRRLLPLDPEGGLIWTANGLALRS